MAKLHQRSLEELPAAPTVRALVLNAAQHKPGGERDTEISRLPDGERDAEIAWLTGGEPLLDAVRAVALGPSSSAWRAGEAGIMRDPRVHLRHDRQMDSGRVSVYGYRRIGAAGPPPRDLGEDPAGPPPRDLGEDN